MPGVSASVVASPGCGRRRCAGRERHFLSNSDGVRGVRMDKEEEENRIKHKEKGLSGGNGLAPPSGCSRHGRDLRGAAVGRSHHGVAVGAQPPWRVASRAQTPVLEAFGVMAAGLLGCQGPLGRVLSTCREERARRKIEEKKKRRKKRRVV